MSDGGKFSLFGSNSGESPEKRTVIPMAVGALLVVIVIAGFMVLNRGENPAPRNPTAPAKPDPYAANLPIFGVQMSAAENFAGGSVTYLEGKINNQGQKTVTGITVELTFKNSLAEVVQRERLPLTVITTREPYVDTANLASTPLKPGAKRDFRLALEHISEDWNREYPAIVVAQVKAQ